MPRALFDQTIVTAPRNKKRARTVIVSVTLHAVALVAIVVAQLSAGAGPEIKRRIDGVLIAAPPPPPPSPPSVTAPAPPSITPINPDAAPTTAVEDPREPAQPVPRVLPSLGPLGVPDGRPGALAGPGIATVGPPPADSRPQGPVPVGGNILPPQRIFNVVPDYPAIARTARVDGTVILEATIDQTGVVTNVRVLRSIALLDRAAIDAVSKWRYTPTRLNGRPISVIMTVTVTFSLR